MHPDDLTDRLLKRALRDDRPLAAPDVCPDAETLAGWSDGTLSAGERAAAEAHAADCDRCLAVMATLAKAVPATPANPTRSRWLSVRWLAPITATATALGLWVLVPDPPFSPESDVPVTQATAESAAPGAAADSQPDDVSRKVRLPEQSPAPLPEQRESSSRARKDEGAPRAEDSLAAVGAPAVLPPVPEAAMPEPPATAAPAAPAPTASAVPPPSAAARATAAPQMADELRRSLAQEKTVAAVEVPSPDPAVRWRIIGALVERSTDGGKAWSRQSVGNVLPLLAGSSPSSTVCWLVGHGGTVFLSSDGRTWRQVAFPVTSDLISVTATDASSATTTTGDGRAFRTFDGGVTWVLQETPAASFFQ